MPCKYSIVIPVYNVVNDLQDCLKSIYSQTLSDFEVIAIDDASTDGSSELLNDLANVYSIKIISLNDSQGPGNARNIGARNALGDYILFVDADDKLAPKLLENLSKIDSELIIFDFTRFWSSGNIQSNPERNILNTLHGKVLRSIEDKSKLFCNFQVCWNKAYKRDFYLREKLKFESGYYEDISFNYNAILKADSISTLPVVGYCYRQRVGSILNSKSDRHSDIINQYDLVYKIFHSVDENKQACIKRKIDEVFISHIFNILLKQRFRLSDTSKKNIIRGFMELLKTHHINLGVNIKTIFKYVFIRMMSSNYLYGKKNDEG